jgi:hypothetical protein
VLPHAGLVRGEVQVEFSRKDEPLLDDEDDDDADDDERRRTPMKIDMNILRSLEREKEISFDLWCRPSRRRC